MEAARHQTIAFLGNYLPRKCGIATFTADLLKAVAGRHPENCCFAVAITESNKSYEYPPDVRFEISEQDEASYRDAAAFLNASADVVSIQHEFGIFGGPAGSHLLTLLRALRVPVVTTLHTVLSEPNGDQRRVMMELVARSTRLVVMTERGRKILLEVYGAPLAKIDLIPHGIPDNTFSSPEDYKGQFGLSGRKVLLTFGLLSPNKGIEHVLNALPEVVAEFPEVVYILLGATHPHELIARGDVYRHSLEQIVERNEIANHVIFHNQFVDQSSLTEFIGAADLYITPYLSEGQITSGTLSYAFGAGKAVISTPYWHAAELLGDGRGVLVPFANSEAIAEEVRGLLRDDTRRATMSSQAYKLGREMVWSKTAEVYGSAFDHALREGTPIAPVVARPGPGPRPHESPDLNLSHLFHMTDSIGLFQHANLTTPNLTEGYCTDDNARALILSVLLSQLDEAPQRLRGLATTYAAFLDRAFDSSTLRFHNFLSVSRQWLDEWGSEDSHGRAVWSLGTVVGRAPHWGSGIRAVELFRKAVSIVPDFTSPRAWAFSLIGIQEFLRKIKGDIFVQEIRDELTQRLAGLFDQVSTDDWHWFEESLSYDNAKLAHALIVSGRATGNKRIYERGMRALHWLVSIQTAEHGHLRPIGSNGFYERHGTRAEFDQQPLEAHATVSACLVAFEATADPWWYEQAQRAFDWFLGWNDLGLALYAHQTGGCRDGLHPDRTNENQGAESTLAFLLSLAEMRLVQSKSTIVRRAGAYSVISQ